MIGCPSLRSKDLIKILRGVRTDSQSPEVTSWIEDEKVSSSVKQCCSIPKTGFLEFSFRRVRTPTKHDALLSFGSKRKRRFTHPSSKAIPNSIKQRKFRNAETRNTLIPYLNYYCSKNSAREDEEDVRYHVRVTLRMTSELDVSQALSYVSL